MFKRQFAFTLLEMLVALVLVSLVVTLSFQFFANVLNIFNRQIEQETLTSQYRVQAWIARTLSGMVWIDDDWGHGGQGDARQIQGLTLASINEIDGVPVPFVLEIKNNSIGGQLNYQVAESAPIVLFAWTTGKAEWLYLNDKNEDISAWKRSDFNFDPKVQPKYVVFRLSESEFPVKWFFSMNNNPWQRKFNTQFMASP